MIRLALVGAAAANSHVAVASRLVDARFVAVVDPSADDAQAAAALLDASITTGDVEDLLARHGDAVDAVVVPSSADSMKVLPATVTQGRHVLAEMPTAKQRAIEALSQLADESGATLMIGQSHRFLPSFQTVRQSLDAGQLGEPGLLRIHRWSPNIAACPLEADVDLALCLFGKLPETVYCTGGGDGAASLPSDYRQLHLGFAGGGMALIDHAPLPDGAEYFTLSLIGSSGAAYADDHHNSQLRFAGGLPTAATTGEGELHRAAQLNAFLDAIRQQAAPPITAADWLAATRVADAARESLQTSAAIALN